MFPCPWSCGDGGGCSGGVVGVCVWDKKLIYCDFWLTSYHVVAYAQNMLNIKRRVALVWCVLSRNVSRCGLGADRDRSEIVRMEVGT